MQGLDQSFFRQSMLAMAIIDAEGKLLNTNDAFQEFLASTDVTYFQELLSSADRKRFEKSLRKQISILDVQPNEAWRKHTRVELEISPLPAEQGAANHYLLLVRDRENRKKMVAKLEKGYLRYHSLFEFNHYAILRCSLSGRIKEVNTAAQVLSGYSAKELIHRPIQSFFSEDLLLVQLPMNITTIKFLRKNNSQLDVELSILPVTANGKTTGFFMQLRDISQAKVLKDRLSNVQTEMKEALQNQQGMIFKFTEIDGRFIHTMCEGALVTRLGLRTDQVVGKQLNDFLSSEEEAKLKENYYRRAWNGEHDVSYEGTIGDVTYFASLKPIRRNGIVTEVIASCVDISARKHAEQYLAKSEKLSVVGQLAAGVAHEIRNPLTALKGFAQLLGRNQDKLPQYLTIMQQELNRIELIVNEFMTLAKPHIHRKETSDISPIIQEVLPIVETQANLAGVMITLNPAENLPTLSCDRNQIKQVLLNLLKNAIEAMPNGGEIRVNVYEADAELVLEVQDQGEGIPDSHLGRVGEPFFTTKESGTGLGLMICQRIMENHHGKMLISSERGKGTTVQLILPATSPF